MRHEMANGMISVVSVNCLPGQEKKAFCHSVGKMTSPHIFFVLDKLDDLFPVKLECACGLDYTIDCVDKVPLRSKKCECGCYLVKYDILTVH
jgi:hypothetical protein